MELFAEVFQKWCSKKFHSKTPVLDSLFNKVARLGVQLFLKETPTQVFSCKIFENFKNSFFIKHLLWLFLNPVGIRFLNFHIGNDAIPRTTYVIAEDKIKDTLNVFRIFLL